MDILELIQHRHSSRVLFDPDRKIADPKMRAQICLGPARTSRGKPIESPFARPRSLDEPTQVHRDERT